jgi:nitrate/nitrite-specific signal transduction histidine kinase
MILVFFVYGLAFFSMGFAIALESRPSSGLRLARYLRYLAAFGILHSIMQWSDMLLLVESTSDPIFSLEAVRLFRTLMLGISSGALFQFGAGILGDRSGRSRWLLALPGIFGLAWVGMLIWLVTIYPPLGSREWLIHGDVWARYLLYLPGSILAGFGLMAQARLLEKADLHQIARDARFAATTFLLNALVSGLVVPPGQQFPDSFLNSDFVQAVSGVPAQMLRAAAALAIAYFVLRMLRLFRIQTARQVEEANQQQIRAQQEALDIQRRSHEEMEQWNRELEGRISQRTAEITLRNRQLMAVNSIAAAVSQSFDLREILRLTLQKSLEALDAQGGGIVLFEHEDGGPTTQFSTGLTEEFMRTVAQTRIDAVVTGRLDSTDEGSSTLRSFVTAPLKAKGQVVGAICAASATAPGFDPEDGRLLTAIGHQVGIAVENARLFAQVQNLAALEERARIAREMHDGLAQLLSFLSVKTRVVQQLVANRHFQKAEMDLDQMQKTVQEAYAEVRQSILSLRTAGEMEQGLRGAIRESAANFTEQNSIPVEVALAEEGEVCFSSEADVQLVRIVQEALANVRKHARAGKVWIRLARQEYEAVLSVEDDGAGFDLAELAGKKRRCFGLETMKERAESIGARLDVSSVPGAGTRIQVRFPLEQDTTRPERAAEGAAG